MKLNPLIIICFYIVLHIIISIVLIFTVFSLGGESFEFVIKSIRYLFYGILSTTIGSAIIYKTWSKENWIILLVFILISIAVIFSGFGLAKGE
jgi:cell division protein FtsW (lipid II flippase)